MPRYYFHVCAMFEMVEDKAGKNLADMREAIRFAIRYARLLSAKSAYRHIDFKVLEIRDENRKLVKTVSFRTEAYAGRMVENITLPAALRAVPTASAAAITPQPKTDSACEKTTDRVLPNRRPGRLPRTKPDKLGIRPRD